MLKLPVTGSDVAEKGHAARDTRETRAPSSDSVLYKRQDTFEAYLWFLSRGDECLNCPSRGQMLLKRDMPLVIRVKPVRPLQTLSCIRDRTRLKRICGS